MSRLLKITRRFQSSTAPVIGYNQESGLCYTEVTCTGGPMTADWTWKTLGSSIEYGKYRSLGPGCSSLRDMAIRVALVNSLSITPETLAEVPWSVAKQLWHKIVASKLDSLHIWRVFASAYHNELEPTLQCRDHVILEPNMGFKDYIPYLTSPSFRWVTFLTLSNITCSRTELVQLSKLTNLGVLTIGQGFKADDIGLDDGVIRYWMRATIESNAFRMLRVLNCRSQREITSKSLAHLAQFPSLAIVNFEQCRVGRDKIEALRWGWKCKTGKDLHNFLVDAANTGSGWNSVNHACFRQGGTLSVPESMAEGVKAIDSVPILHCSLGASSPNAAVDTKGDLAIRSFQRLIPCPPAVEAAKASKRPMVDEPRLTGSPRKKPMMRASKQQDLGNLLMGFGS